MKHTKKMKMNTVVFVDFENLLYGYLNKHRMPPDLMGWLRDLQTRGNIQTIYVFGDFANDFRLSSELQSIRAITPNIIETGHSGDKEEKKDHTDFIMAHMIYTTTIDALFSKARIDQFILVTGDGHFSTVANYIANNLHKTVGVYGVKGTINKHLLLAADWYVELPSDEERAMFSENADILDFDMAKVIVESIIKAHKRQVAPTYIGTIKHLSSVERRYWHVENTLNQLMDSGIIYKEALSNEGPKALFINFNKWFALDKSRQQLLPASSSQVLNESSNDDAGDSSPQTPLIITGRKSNYVGKIAYIRSKNDKYYNKSGEIKAVDGDNYYIEIEGIISIYKRADFKVPHEKRKK